MSAALSPPRIIRGLCEVVDRYDAFLVDSYGVLHDGATPFAGAIQCLGELRRRGKRVVVLTNTPRRAATVGREIARVGIRPDLYDVLVSAGEHTVASLMDPAGDHGLAAGSRYHYVGPERSREILPGLPFREAASEADADFLLITGIDPVRPRLLDYEPMLTEALRRGLPAVCANPDREAIRSGERGPAAGAVSTRYAAMGGRVINYGKPYPGIYHAALGHLADIPRERVVAVGDAFYTDIAGAARAGLDTVFVMGGIHAAEIGDIERPDPSRLAELFARDSVAPTWSLAWMRFA